MLWDPCMQQFFLLESRTRPLSNLWYTLKDSSRIEKEQQGCTQLYPLHLHRHVILIFFMCFFMTQCKTWSANDVLAYLNWTQLFLQVTIEFPYVFIQTLIYSTIFYFMASFEWNVWKFVWYIYFMYFTLLYFTFFGMMTTSVSPNHNIAAILAAPFYMMWNLFSGFMISRMVIFL